ncbi:MAG: DNA primase [Acetobacter sp.]|nr:DNA primase [Acetobacter sp.]
MAIKASFLDELRARTPIVSVIGRRVKLVRSGRHWKGCCPFHGEKTPSFYVYEDHFHCFGCGVHGDVITFVMQSEGQTFREAVETLAASVGMEVPSYQTEDSHRAAVHTRSLEEILSMAQKLWRDSLYHTPEGQEGLNYLLQRGLTHETLRSFGIGWASARRGHLIEVLQKQGISAENMAEAGLIRCDEAGHPKGELFWKRVIFPIHDHKGRLISFGGRIVGEGQPKYLNGPDTPLFSKRRVLFALDRVRAALRAPRTVGQKPHDVLVVEGYMDVIALHQAGFVGAVAPLGTALTSEQMEALWQIAPAPILCFDGDKAGRKAAIRAMEVALSHLQVERSLRICLLPEGEDPDSLLRQRVGNEGRDVMANLLAESLPLSEVIFPLMAAEFGNKPSPEERAALRHKLMQVVELIPDKVLRAEYRSTLLDHFYTHFRSFHKNSRKNGKDLKDIKEEYTSVHSVNPLRLVVEKPVFDQTRERQRLLLCLLLKYPALIPRVEEAFCTLELSYPFDEIRSLLLDFAAEVSVSKDLTLWEWISNQHAENIVQTVLQEKDFIAGMKRQREFQKEMEDEQNGLENASIQWWHLYGLLNRSRFEHEVEYIATHLFSQEVWDPEEWKRLQSLLEIREQLRCGDIDESATNASFLTDSSNDRTRHER